MKVHFLAGFRLNEYADLSFLVIMYILINYISLLFPSSFGIVFITCPYYDNAPFLSHVGDGTVAMKLFCHWNTAVM